MFYTSSSSLPTQGDNFIHSSIGLHRKDVQRIIRRIPSEWREAKEACGHCWSWSRWNGESLHLILFARSFDHYSQSCAATLAQHPNRYQVTILERMEVCGGQATSISLDKSKYGTSWLNDGVQGGSPIFKHTFNFMRRYGHEPRGVKLQVSFGQGKESFWTNCFPSQMVDQFSADIKKFGKVLKLIKYTMPVLGLVPIKTMLRMFFFSKDFGDKMVFPLIALFLGTGSYRFLQLVST